MSVEDANKTNEHPQWQTSWTSEFISNPRFEKYSIKIGDELLAIGAYEIHDKYLYVHIVYMEAAPNSNPVLAGKSRKYNGIGKLLIAQGIKLSVDNNFGGDVVLEAKTTKLAEHYERDFKAVKIFSNEGSVPTYLISDNSALDIFSSYLE